MRIRPVKYVIVLILKLVFFTTSQKVEDCDVISKFYYSAVTELNLHTVNNRRKQDRSQYTALWNTTSYIVTSRNFTIELHGRTVDDRLGKKLFI